MVFICNWAHGKCTWRDQAVTPFYYNRMTSLLCKTPYSLSAKILFHSFVSLFQFYNLRQNCRIATMSWQLKAQRLSQEKKGH